MKEIERIDIAPKEHFYLASKIDQLVDAVNVLIQERNGKEKYSEPLPKPEKPRLLAEKMRELGHKYLSPPDSPLYWEDLAHLAVEECIKCWIEYSNQDWPDKKIPFEYYLRRELLGEN